MARGCAAVRGDRPPAYPDKAALAAELVVFESTVDELVRRGVLPKPIKMTNGCVRWCWATVERSLASLQGGPDAVPSDPAMEGVRNVAKAPEGRRAAS